jgi:hypothetical protein
MKKNKDNNYTFIYKYIHTNIAIYNINLNLNHTQIPSPNAPDILNKWIEMIEISGHNY